MRKKPLVKSVSNEIAGRYSRSVTLVNISFHEGGFPENTPEFSMLLQKSLTRAP